MLVANVYRDWAISLLPDSAVGVVKDELNGQPLGHVFSVARLRFFFRFVTAFFAGTREILQIIHQISIAKIIFETSDS